MGIYATLDDTGVHVPSYSEVLAGLQAIVRSIYGADAYIAPDSQDGQFLAAWAASINEVNQVALAVYQQFSPTYAQGVGLSSLLKLNGTKRQSATHSTATVTIVGVTGTTITNGIVRDGSGQLWNLPASVVIPGSGTIDVLATAQNEGALEAPPNTITNIYTLVPGWQTVTNAAAATVGAPVETDAQARRRQATIVQGPASSLVAAIQASIADVAGVTQLFVYENDTGSADGNGVPAHTIYAVVLGGAAQDIINAIGVRKPPGIQTYGTSSGTYTDARGETSTIHFYAVTLVPVTCAITVQKLGGWVDSTKDLIKQSCTYCSYYNSCRVKEAKDFDVLVEPRLPSVSAD